MGGGPPGCCGPWIPVSPRNLTKGVVAVKAIGWLGKKPMWKSVVFGVYWAENHPRGRDATSRTSQYPGLNPVWNFGPLRQPVGLPPYRNQSPGIPKNLRPCTFVGVLGKKERGFGRNFPPGEFRVMEIPIVRVQREKEAKPMVWKGITMVYFWERCPASLCLKNKRSIPVHWNWHPGNVFYFLYIAFFS